MGCLVHDRRKPTEYADTPVALMDPALGRTGAHNRGFVDLLIHQGIPPPQLGIWCHQSLDGDLLKRLQNAGAVVHPLFETDFYQVINKSGGVAEHWPWIHRLCVAYQRAMKSALDAWPKDTVRVIHHTLSWEHAQALALAIRLIGPAGERLQHLALLMYSPGLDFEGRIYEHDRALNFRLAFASLDKLPNVELHASCSEYATAYAGLLGRAAPLPLHPCFLGDWHTPPPVRSPARKGHERVILHLGEVKAQKGFLRLPALLRRALAASPATRHFVIQFVEVRNDAGRRVLAELEGIAAGHDNVSVHHGFWTDERLQKELAACDALCLDYDANAYAHKTSGLLWLAAWYRILVVVPRQGWLGREARRLGLPVLDGPEDMAGGLSVPSGRGDQDYRRQLFTPFGPWLKRQWPTPRSADLPGSSSRNEGRDILVFWKQNDSGLYGRRVDMVVRYLASRPDVRRVIVVDAPIGDRNLTRLGEADSATHQGRKIHATTLDKVAGRRDHGKVSYRVFVCPLAEYRFSEDGTDRPRFIEGYIAFLQDTLAAAGIDPKQSLFWIYPRNFHASSLLRKFRPARVVVDVVDDDRAWPGVTEARRKELSANLQQLLGSADQVLANCEPVRESLREFRSDIHLVPNGCDACPPRELPETSLFREFCMGGGKVIGFAGNLEAKIDIPLLHKVATKFDHCRIVLIGSTHANPAVRELAGHPNVSMPGVVPYAEIGAWIRRFDVALIPHLRMDMTRFMNPLKAYVYLSHQVPVVATNVPNIDRAGGLIRVAQNHDEFLDAVGKVLAGHRPPARVFRRWVRRNSWKQRLEQHVDDLLAR